jgi:nucleoside-diphosphate-sugar epimerase
MKTILITGAAGFIGSKTAHYLLEMGHRVIGIDNLNDYYDVKLKNHRIEKLKKNKNFEFSKIDIESIAQLEKLFKKYQFSKVFNLAARAGVRYSIEKPHIYFTTNSHGSLNILEMMRKYHVPKYVLASTSSLYAGLEMPFLEDLPVNTPISPYAASKKSAEAIAYTYHHLHGIDVSIVRYFTVYGPASRPDMAQFRFMKWIDSEEKIELFGDGTQARDFTYVDDIALGTIAAGDYKAGFEIFNLGGGNQPITVNTMIESLESHLGKKAVVKNLPFSKADMLVTWANIDKANKLLNWYPQVSFEQGIKNCVDDFKENYNFYKDIKL